MTTVEDLSVLEESYIGGEFRLVQAIGRGSFGIF